MTIKELHDCKAPADLPAQQQEPSHSDIQLAEQIMSDCGCSTNNQRLLERITERLAKHRPAQQQEPVAWMTQARCFVDLSEFTEAEAKLFGWKPVYTSLPAQKECEKCSHKND